MSNKIEHEALNISPIPHQVRKFPKLMLCLQNGHFDHPDRMFNRVQDAFNNCLNNMSDFKVKCNFYATHRTQDNIF